MNDKERNKRFNKARREQIKHKARIFTDTRKELIKLLSTAEKSIIATLAGAPTEWETFFLPELQRSINQAMNTFADGYSVAILEASNKMKVAGVALIDAPLAAGGATVATYLPQVSIRQLAAMRSFMTDRILDIGLSTANKINSELGLVAIGAQPQSVAVSNIQRLLKNGSRQRAITIARTELGRVYSMATDERLRQARKLVPGLKKKWLKSGKLHSRTGHDAINGQVRDVDKPYTLPSGKQLMYPRDPAAPAAETINCGCDSLPYVEQWNSAKIPLAA
tara:strand:- start:844 stop:1680 length:837 start_codon:yes stop_codon:yes gene_type:complete